jgi:hypothetical protein
MDLQDNYVRLLQAHEEIKLQFISTELDMAVTFCELAFSAADPERAERNFQNAHRAYEAAMRRLADAGMPEPDREIAGKIKRVEELFSDLDRHQPREGRATAQQKPK